jgi:hypothetical protein
MAANTTPTKQQGDRNEGLKARAQKMVMQSPLGNGLSRFRKRRARSAPPALRTPMMEQHFRVDRERKVVLPGVPKHDDDLARDSHDFFNLIVLVPIVALNVMNWNWDKIFKLGGKGTIEDAWTGEWFQTFFFSVLSYFVVDLLWILIVPKCVKSPSTIYQHHIVTILYIMIPYYRPDIQWCMGACMSVEINTWFLIARRVFNKQGFPPWIIDLSFVSIRVKLISIGFYVTWILIRCIVYPIMLVYLTKRWWRESLRVGTSVNIELINPLMQSSFCILNFKWTYDLIMSKLRYYKRKNKGKAYAYAPSKGL